MMEILLVLLFIAIIIGIVTALLIYQNKKINKDVKKEPDYKVFFILGVCFLPLGIPMFIATKNPGLMSLSALGVIYMSIGLANRDKWKEN